MLWLRDIRAKRQPTLVYSTGESSKVLHLGAIKCIDRGSRVAYSTPQGYTNHRRWYILQRLQLDVKTL